MDHCIDIERALGFEYFLPLFLSELITCHRENSVSHNSASGLIVVYPHGDGRVATTHV